MLHRLFPPRVPFCLWSQTVTRLLGSQPSGPVHNLFPQDIYCVFSKLHFWHLRLRHMTTKRCSSFITLTLAIYSVSSVSLSTTCAIWKGRQEWNDKCRTIPSHWHVQICFPEIILKTDRDFKVERTGTGVMEIVQNCDQSWRRIYVSVDRIQGSQACNRM